MKKILSFLFCILATSIFLQAKEIIVTNSNDNTGSMPENSFRAAIAAAETGDIIKFNIPETDIITLMATIGISGAEKTLVIDGLNEATGNFIVFKNDKDVATRLFSIATSKGSTGLNITFKNLLFEDIYATQTGAVISSGHSSYTTPGAIKIKLENCWFKDCITSILSTNSTGGGGVYFLSHGTELTILNCLFENNRMEFSDPGEVTTIPSWGGGVIGAAGSNTAKLIISNSTFSGNYSASRGGAISITHPIDMINCTVTGNSAVYGGGLYHNSADTQINIINSIITHNYASQNTNRADIYKNRSNTTSNIMYSLIGATIEDLGTGSSLYDTVDLLFESYTQKVNGEELIPLLANNGGPLPTVALAKNGVASGKAIAILDGFSIPTVDQRGIVRQIPPSMGAYDFADDMVTINNIPFNGTTLPTGATNLTLTGTWTESDYTAFNTLITANNKITCIDLHSVNELPKIVLTPANPNCLIYLADGMTINGNHLNIIAGTVAESIILEDSYDFDVSKEFSAKEISYTRTPAVWADGTHGWETIILPFEADTYYSEAKSLEIAPFATINDKDGLFWLKKYTGDNNGNVINIDFPGNIVMQAHTPYVVAFPGNKWGTTTDLSGGSITFSASNEENGILVRKTITDDHIISGTNYSFAGVYCESTVSGYLLGKTHESSNTFSYSDEAKIAPFRAYFKVNEGIPDAGPRLMIGNSGQGGTTHTNPLLHNDEQLVIVNIPDGVKITSGIARTVTVVSIDGCLVAMADVKAESGIFIKLTKGLYIINGQKVAVK